MAVALVGWLACLALDANDRTAIPAKILFIPSQLEAYRAVLNGIFLTLLHLTSDMQINF